MKQTKTPLWELIYKRFPIGEYAVFQEVRDAAGMSANRSADGIAMNLYPSRGLAINGIEVKSSRSDWLSEKKKPEKAEAIFKYCDYFWLITDGEDIAKLDEIPDAWGWLCRKGEKIYTMKDAPKQTPMPIGRHFLAALLKRASKDMIPISSVQDKLGEEFRKGVESGEKNKDYYVKHQLEEYEALKKAVAEFEESSGIKISTSRYSFNGKKVGEVVNAIIKHGIDNEKTIESLGFIKQRIDELSKEMSSTIEKLKL